MKRQNPYDTELAHTLLREGDGLQEIDPKWREAERITTYQLSPYTS